MKNPLALVIVLAVAGCAQSPIQQRAAQIKAEQAAERQRVLTRGSAEQVAEMQLTERFKTQAPDAPAVFWEYLQYVYVPVVIYQRQPTPEMLRLDQSLSDSCNRFFATAREHNEREAKAIRRGQSSAFGPSGIVDERAGAGAACNFLTPGALARYANGTTVKKSQEVLGEQDAIFQK